LSLARLRARPLPVRRRDFSKTHRTAARGQVCGGPTGFSHAGERARRRRCSTSAGRCIPPRGFCAPVRWQVTRAAQCYADGVGAFCVRRLKFSVVRPNLRGQYPGIGPCSKSQLPQASSTSGCLAPRWRTCTRSDLRRSARCARSCLPGWCSSRCVRCIWPPCRWTIAREPIKVAVRRARYRTARGRPHHDRSALFFLAFCQHCAAAVVGTTQTSVLALELFRDLAVDDKAVVVMQFFAPPNVA